jgi:hypothetical protein
MQNALAYQAKENIVLTDFKKLTELSLAYVVEPCPAVI